MLSTTRAAAASPPPTEDKSSSPHYQASIVSHSLSSSSIRPHEDRSTLDLINSYAVFKLCTIPVVVETTPTIIEFMEKIGLSWPMYAIIKRTFFRHFCGGENLEEVLPTMNKLSKNSVGSILDLAMEADIEDTVSQTPIESQASAAKIRGMMEESINIAAHQPDSFIAVKVTAMVPPTILLRWTNTLHVLKKHFAASGDNGSDRISVQDLNKIMATQLNLSEAESKSIRSVFEKVNKDGYISWLDFTERVSPIYPQTRNLLLVKPSSEREEFKTLVSDDFAVIDLVVPELQKLCQYAKDRSVRIMIDAEQTYFQAAIDDVTLHLCRTVNPPMTATQVPMGAKAVVFNTYQMYLVDALARLKLDVERSNRYGFTFGAKIVRGAYMHSERERATELGSPDPIHSSLLNTHASYNSAIEFLISKISETQASSSSSQNVKPLSFVVASHNRESIEKTMALMSKYQVKPKEGTVGFAQLMGMQDGTSSTLGKSGFACYKYIPYGPISVAIPYLIRRAQENSTLMKGSGVAEDLRGLTEEIGRRLFFRKQ